MNSPTDVWAKVLSLMEQELTATAVSTWFDDSVAVEMDNTRFVIHTPSNFKKEIN